MDRTKLEKNTFGGKTIFKLGNDFLKKHKPFGVWMFLLHFPWTGVFIFFYII